MFLQIAPKLLSRVIYNQLLDIKAVKFGIPQRVNDLFCIHALTHRILWFLI